MKVILEIGRVAFLAPDEASAAKVVDLLGAMQPVENDYYYSDEPGQSRHVFFDVPQPSFLLSGAERYLELRNREAYQAWKAEQEKPVVPEGGAL